MVKIQFSKQLQKCTHGQKECLFLHPVTLAEILQEISDQFPELHDVVFDQEKKLLPFVGLSLNGELLDQDELPPEVLPQNSLLIMMNAVAGG